MKIKFLLPLVILGATVIVLGVPIALDHFILSKFITSSTVSGSLSFFIWIMVMLVYWGHQFDKKKND